MSDVKLHLLTFLCFFGISISSCPDGAIEYSNSPVCYRYYASPVPFYEAQDICKRNNGNLASITSAFTNYFIGGERFSFLYDGSACQQLLTVVLWEQSLWGQLFYWDSCLTGAVIRWAVVQMGQYV